MISEEEIQKERSPMEVDYYNPRLNRYDTGPGLNLPDDLQPGALMSLPDRSGKTYNIYLRNISRELKESGIRNLCSKYGNIHDLKVFDTRAYSTKAALVMFKTENEAAECLRKINASSTGIGATFQKMKVGDNQSQHSTPSEDEPSPSDDEQSPALHDESFFNSRRQVKGPFSKPTKLSSFGMKPLISTDDYTESEVLKQCDPDMDFVNEALNNCILMKNKKNEKITSGRSNYKHPTDIKNKMKILHEKSQGTLDMEKLEFVHKGGNFISETGDCKNCGLVTMTVCKGCNQFYCSQECWEKYNYCECRSSDSDPVIAKVLRRRRDIISRGGKINVSRSNPTIEKKSTETSTAKMSSRVRILKASQDWEAVNAQRRLLQQRTIGRCQPPSNNTEVVITTVIDHKNVFLRSIVEEDNTQYVKYLNDVAECSKTAMTLKEMPKKDDIVLAEFEGIYYRALVVRIENDMAVVAYLEFGNMDEKPFTELKELREDLRYAKRFTFKARLSGVEGNLASDLPLTYLYNLLAVKIPLKFFKKDDQFSTKGVLCELVRSDSNENVSRKIMTLNSLKPEETDDKIVRLKDIETTSLIGKNVPVIILDNSTVVHGCITVIRKEDMQKLQMMQERIAEFCKQEYKSPYTPRDTEVCLAKGDDNQWYRVQLGESVGDGKPLMIFIDFGNVDNVSVGNMRRMPLEFDYPNYSVFAEIGNIPPQEELTNEQIIKLRDYFPVQSNMIVDICHIKRGIDESDEDMTIVYFEDLKL